MRFHAWMLAIASIAPPAMAQAEAMTIGHVAPSAAPVQMYVNDAPVGPELTYGSFAQVSDVPAQFRAEVRSTSDGQVLAAGDFQVEPGNPVKPLLALIGDGENKPRAIHFQQRDPRLASAPDPRATSAFVIHHLAPYQENTITRLPPGALQCTTASTSSVGEWRQDYGSASVSMFALNGRPGSCILQIDHPVLGRFSVSADLAAHRTVRVLLIGDGAQAPVEAVVLDDGQLVNSFGIASPGPASALLSESLWFDVARPSQAVTFYEFGGAAGMSGFWITHDSAGKPVWYFLDGVRTSLPGQRDIALHRFSADPDKPVSVDAGSARLFYIDCNQAELRILSGEREFHTLRLRRSRAVAACEVFD